VYLLHIVASMHWYHVRVSDVAIFVREQFSQCVFNYMRNFNFFKLNDVAFKVLVPYTMIQRAKPHRTEKQVVNLVT
jgi:hypothetical protein